MGFDRETSGKYRGGQSGWQAEHGGGDQDTATRVSLPSCQQTCYPVAVRQVRADLTAVHTERSRNGLSLSIKRPTSPKPPPILPRNDILATDSWADEIIWDATKVSADLFSDADDQSEDGDAAAREATARLAAAAVKVKGKQLDPYNLSNDHLYEHTREARNKIRQTFGAIEVFHAGPAKALQMPFVCSFFPATGTL